jgi:polysaccharide biosynthesis protein PslH
VFVGAMDWMPNIDGMRWFVEQIWPRLREKHPRIRLGIVGRSPDAEARKWAEQDSRIQVTGTVADVRPYLWGSRVSIVPLRIGGGTRLKIFEAIAAGVPVVSTAVGAEGLPVQHGETIRLADEAGRFAEQCDELLTNEAERFALRDRGREWVESHYSWDSVVGNFEGILERVSVPVGRG